MKKLIFISFLFVTIQTTLYAQSKGLSEEGYKHWVRAVSMMKDAQKDIDYLKTAFEFINVLKYDSTYADVYYNLGILYTKLGDFGGGVRPYDIAKRYYNKYLELRPSEKNALAKELIQLDLKKEKFLENIGLNMIPIEKGIYLEKGKPIEVDAFYIQNHVFTVADFKRLITPIAVSMASVRTGKNFSIPIQESPTGNDNVPYISSYITAEQIVEVLNYVTGKHFFIPKQAHWERIAFILSNGKYKPSEKQLNSLGIYVGGVYPTANRPSIYEWVNLSKGEKKLAFQWFPFTGKCTIGMYFLYWPYRDVYNVTNDITEAMTFRLALSIEK